MLQKMFPQLARLIFAAVLSACGGSPASVPDGPARVVVVGGGAQRGLAGERLPRQVQVLVTDLSGSPLAGRRVQFDVASGTGSVSPAAATTGAAGSAQAEWTLGERDVRIQHMRIAVDGGDTALVEATAVGPDETDVIVLRGALGPMKGVVIVEDGIGTILPIIQERVSADTVIPIHPIDGGTTGIVAFPWANAPAWARATWTPGIDTLHLDLRAPVSVPVVVTVAAEPFAEHRQTVESHLAEMERIWAEEGAGLALEVVEIVDATGELGSVEVPAEDACSVGFARVIPGRIHVYFVGRLGGSQSRGLACPPGLAFVAAGSGSATSLLAHEIGHLLALDHVPFGLMQPLLTERWLSDGQVFRIHFSERSALHLVFQAAPVEGLRDCRSTLGPGCLPVEYEFR